MTTSPKAPRSLVIITNYNGRHFLKDCLDSVLAQEGAAFFSPLINQGQSAILGVGAELFAPEQSQGWFHLTLAFDHQLSNGREATQFLVELRRRLLAYEQAWGGVHREEPFCQHCERTLSTLREIKAYLVEEVRPDGAKGQVCSLCLRGL